MERFTSEPFQPEVAGNMLSAQSVAALDPLGSGEEGLWGPPCDACHGENGIGTDAGPKLVDDRAEAGGRAFATVATSQCRHDQGGDAADRSER